MAKRWLQSVDLEIDAQGRPVFETALTALAALIADGEMKVRLASAVATITADIVDLDVEAVTDKLDELLAVLVTMDTDTGTMAADLGTLAGLDFATDAKLDTIAGRLVGMVYGSSAADSLEALTDVDFATDARLGDIRDLLAVSQGGGMTIADLLESAFGAVSPFWDQNNFQSLADMQYDAFSGAGNIFLPPPFHDSTGYNTVPDILYDTLTGAGNIVVSPFHESWSLNSLADILWDALTGGGAVIPSPPFHATLGQGQFYSVADMLSDVLGGEGTIFLPTVFHDTTDGTPLADIVDTMRADIAAIKVKTDQFNFYNGNLQVATVGEQP